MKPLLRSITPADLLRPAIALLLMAGLMLGGSPAFAGLPPGNAVTDPDALLRDALPVQQEDLVGLQHRLEGTSDDLRAKRWSALLRTIRRTQAAYTTRRAVILDAVPDDRRQRADGLMEQLRTDLEGLAEAAETRDRDAFLADRRRALTAIGGVEALLVQGAEVVIPPEFDALPRLVGRATVSISTNKGELLAVVDGYNAPLTAGAFVDLVRRGFYDGLPFIRAEDFYVLQTGDPKGDADGFVDPASGRQRTVPLEIRIPGEEAPFYNQTFEDLGLYKATPTLPFATKGTMGWAHSDQALDDGSSQFFLFLFEPELTPAGLNLIDGRYAAFGYVVDGFDVLEELTADDRVERIRLVNGEEMFMDHA
ncbi:peptidylprolyl isomerase [Synechococcus sp. RSCCF101]|uniref:peptidylprolyl isomerase n=1 Tax=Synechococcus sp. RSCCF101 TaxID=2511069 RepID=UPI00124497FD|nr:peptidylprolyl isomerase [Synechococcus sp. RSCCF101]QEY32561.1 peptidylprolyl isomerase [Synechococcus sp. RSCCF101]